jgi:hypothetical protein
VSKLAPVWVMATPNDLIEVGQRAPGTAPGASEQPRGRSAWLLQALLARDRALRLFQSHLPDDLAQGEVVEKNDSSVGPSAEKSVSDLTADFLAESEKLLKLATNLAESGCLVEGAIAARLEVPRNLT